MFRRRHVGVNKAQAQRGRKREIQSPAHKFHGTTSFIHTESTAPSSPSASSVPPTIPNGPVRTRDTLALGRRQGRRLAACFEGSGASLATGPLATSRGLAVVSSSCLVRRPGAVPWSLACAPPSEERRAAERTAPALSEDRPLGSPLRPSLPSGDLASSVLPWPIEGVALAQRAEAAQPKLRWPKSPPAVRTSPVASILASH